MNDFTQKVAADLKCFDDFVRISYLPSFSVLSFEGDTDVLRMVFRSDSVSHRRGFEARVRQLRNSCYRPVGEFMQEFTL